MPVQFFFVDTTITLSKRAEMKNFIMSIFKAEGRLLGNINYVFCSDEYLLGINRQFLKHDYYTDIITFDMSEPGQPLQAEIYISLDRVRENSKMLGTILKHELHRVVFHGALHLCGYEDKTKKDTILMRKAEDKYLDLYFKGFHVEQ